MPGHPQPAAQSRRRTGPNAAPHRSDLRSALARDLATLAGSRSPLRPAARAAIAEIYAADLQNAEPRIPTAGKVGTSRFCA
ncbi:MAG: hypothetical protein GY895_09915 [Phycisphaera sp.]|nr:hypothetical protein [Phycisphaera sp.]